MQIDTLQATWNQFGLADPLQAILTVPDHTWELRDFFQTGEAEIQQLTATLATLQISVDARGEALDFGCGVGRLTQALCQHFRLVTGVDIAPSMIQLARQYNSHEEQCRYVLNGTSDLTIFDSNQFSLIYSDYVLQHVANRYAVQYMREFARVLKPGGVLVFQLPSRAVSVQEKIKTILPSSIRRGARRLIRGTPMGSPIMEMHPMHQTKVRRVLASVGFTVVDVRRQAHDPRWISLMYYAVKNSA